MTADFRSRRFGGMLCVAALHVGAWYWMVSVTHKHVLAPSPAPASHEIILRFFTPLPKPVERAARRVVHPDAGGIATAPPARTAARESRQQGDLPSDAEPSDSKDAAPAPTAVGEPIAASIIDRDNVKRVIAGMVAEERSRDIASGAALRPQGSAAQKAIGQALRPGCENGDPARAGNIQLGGLMKLPSLMLGAVSDKGCRW